MLLLLRIASFVGVVVGIFARCIVRFCAHLVSCCLRVTPRLPERSPAIEGTILQSVNLSKEIFAEQASKRITREPTGLDFGEGRRRWGRRAA